MNNEQNTDATAPIMGVSVIPPMTGTYECKIENWSTNPVTVSNEVRFYSVRCGWLKSSNEVVIEYKLK